jgi:hypothetical protein
MLTGTALGWQTLPGWPLLHAAVGYRPHYYPMLEWDLSLPPDTANIAGTQPGTSKSLLAVTLGQAANSPPLYTMTVLYGAVPHKIGINPKVAIGTPTISSAQQYVTVHHVLVGLYTFFQSPLPLAEFEAEPASVQQAIYRAFLRRIEQSDNPATQKLEGAKRIDLLLASGKTLFLGLSLTKESKNILTLQLDERPVGRP